jgi:hypothetical protein
MLSLGQRPRVYGEAKTPALKAQFIANTSSVDSLD